GQRVLIDNGALVDVSGSAGGGLIRIGGDFHGANADVRNAEYTGVAPTAQLRADGIDNGAGGRVVVWADNTTRYYGTISAEGGRQGGDGGYVEVSGKDSLVFRGDVSTLAPRGKRGTLLLDPTDITIIDSPIGAADDAQLDADVPTVGDAAGLIKQTDSAAATMTLSSAKVESIALANSIDLSASNSITINDLVTNVVTTKTLTLDTGGGSASFKSGAGGFTMASDNTLKVTNGSLLIDSTVFGVGTVSVGTLTASGGVTLKGTTVTLNGPISVTTAGAGVSITGATTLAAGGGAITLTGNNAANDVTLGSVDGAQNLNITAAGGDIVLGAVGGTTPLTGVTIAANTASLQAVTTNGAQNYSGVGTTTLNGTLAVNTAGAGVSAGTTLLAAGGGAITLTGNNAANDVTLGRVDGAQNLNITAAGGDIVLGAVGGTTPLTGVTINSNTASIQDTSTTGDQTYNARVSAGAVSLNAGSGTITATNANNDFTGAVNLAGGTTQITDGNALTLGTLATGALTAASTGALNLGSGSASSIVAASNGGPVSQSGALSVSGTTNVNAGANTITLANPGNDFTGAVGLTTTGANNATLKDTNALVLGASSVGGNLDVTAKGNI